MNSSQIKSSVVTLLINLEENEPCLVKGSIHWQNTKDYFSLEIIEADPQGQAFVNKLDERLMSPAGPTQLKSESQTKKLASRH